MKNQVFTPPGRVLFSADHHLNHAGVIRMCRRPFASVEEMNGFLIEAWNSVVRPNDTVFHLGDFAMGASPEQCAGFFGALRGRKHFIVGNHDKARVTSLAWESVSERATVDTGGHRLVLDHYPLRAWNGVFRGALHLHGHTHGSLSGTSQSCDVGVDCWAYRPVALPDILERLAATPARPEEIERAAAREAGDA
ncbi:metallophosphoesterase family protein [Methylobacterium sp. J-070]|uniref:metallophosphoesterase family protein n=1 Tax=Methylobacterium sp. J-070 TaxID=2836650 RepID=UPI001FBBC034|nr:metallophosphoesterase family protein [Methylobacterium sp. J-070]MCJ2048803.1 metallophosphoesterase family protein [Methylobacterium sp. J-070]